MQIFIKASCRDCHKESIFLLRSIGDCGTHIHLKICCQRCGLHTTDWVTKTEWQELICAAKELENEQKKKVPPKQRK